MYKTIRIFDTTLRDGEQSPGCSMNLEEKIEVARQLDRLKVDVIEAGFAISSPGDFQSVQAIAGVVKNSAVASLSRALEKDIDAAYEAVRGAVSPLIHTFLSTSPVHMQYKLRMTPEQVLERTRQMVSYARAKCPAVEFSAEDATRSQPEFLARVLQAAIEAGATIINVPDTVGYVTPDEMAGLIGYLTQNVPDLHKAILSVHCHNDLGMAVANSLTAVGAGATQVECAVNGLGERAGNAALEEVVMALHTRRDSLGVACRVDTTQLYRASRLVYNVVGMTPPRNKAIVGPNAFAHESGIHQHGVMAERTTYEIMTPESIGLSKNRMVLGKHSGRHAFKDRLQELGYEVTAQEVDRYFQEFKDLCDKKKTVTDDDIEAIVTHSRGEKPGKYALVRFDVHAGNAATSSCVVRLEADGETTEEVALGDGPIDAAYNAIDKITGLGAHELEDYAIHSISQGRDALGEVIVKVKAGNKTVSGRGLSTDIIQASILAYLNAVNKLLEKGEDRGQTGDT
ncbi:MAG: 2-isopropylmalate synthase [Eubacteriales bacterium]|nr:2-isopropylmalate synthase [Eubacteriales bacterium]